MTKLGRETELLPTHKDISLIEFEWGGRTMYTIGSRHRDDESIRLTVDEMQQIVEVMQARLSE